DDSDPMPRPPRVPEPPDPTRGLFSSLTLRPQAQSLVEQLAAVSHEPRVRFNGENGARLVCTLRERSPARRPHRLPPRHAPSRALSRLRLARPTTHSGRPATSRGRTSACGTWWVSLACRTE